MPSRPRQACEYPGCRATQRGGRFCPRHRPRYRTPDHKRVYQTKQWLKTRAVVLLKHPLCVACLRKGKTARATDVDHIVPRRSGGADTLDNLQALCHSCHSQKTRAENRKESRWDALTRM